MQIALMILIGILTGFLSGLFGIGGGVVLVPLLVIFLNFKQKTASGTSLVALLLPVGLLGVIEYYKAGKITGGNIRYGLLIAFGITVGTYFGARLAVDLQAEILRKIFALFLILVAVKMWFSPV